ncbi:MAG TPA: hypothetical protein VGV38_09465 [Pyrinomonadaceae bacterium]|nr:hypothetical protein [Pyrinomonadaceae bacterium]
MMNVGQESSLTVVAVGGFSSNSGKTTLVCELLRAFPGWEAVKMTRGHYRSCGRDAHACCVSHLLGEEPLVLSGRERTYAPGKDTGRFWEAGASNVHWAVATDAQVGGAARQALGRVESAGVFIEGNSFLKHVAADFVLLTARAGGGPLKASARRALRQADAIYLSEEDGAGESCGGVETRERFAAWRAEAGYEELFGGVPTYAREDLPELFERVRAAHAARLSARGSRSLEHEVLGAKQF